MFDVTFLDSGRTATQKPDPAYPDGMEIDLRHPGQKGCCRNLPYPAPRCGHYVVVCTVCGYRALISVAGRPDDPKNVTMPCLPRKEHLNRQ